MPSTVISYDNWDHIKFLNLADPSGRFVVSLPFKETEPLFDNSHAIAMRRFLSLERRLACDTSLCDAYRLFMKDISIQITWN